MELNFFREIGKLHKSCCPFDNQISEEEELAGRGQTQPSSAPVVS